MNWTTMTSTWLLLHGTPLKPAIWRQVRHLLTDQPVRTPDCSRVPAGDAAFSMAAGIDTVLDAGPIDVVGHSFGGQIALDLALLRPERVRSLTLICCRDTPYPAFAATARQLRSTASPVVGDTLARWFTESDLQAEGPAVREARHGLETASLTDWANALDAIAGYDRRDRVGELTMPVTLIAAGRDAVSTPRAMCDLAHRIPHANLVVQREWTHMSPFVHSDAVAAMLKNAREL